MADPGRMPIAILTNARHHLNSESYKNAFDLYLHAVLQYPHVKRNIEFEFRVTMMKFNEQLSATHNYAIIFENFQTAMRAFPGNVHIMNDIGKYLFRHNYLREALCHFERALEIDRSLVNAQRYMDYTKRSLFPRKYYRFLNDDRRHQAYLQALREIASRKNNNCIEGGISEEYANSCVTVSAKEPDFSATWAHVANKILIQNKLLDILTINIETEAVELNDICSDRTLLVTNTFDSGLLGKNLLLNLRTAWEKNLAEYGLVVPGRADFYVAGASCNQILKKYQISESGKQFLWIEDMFVHSEVSCSGDTYRAEDIASYRDFKFLTRETLVFQIDFNSYTDIIQNMAAIVPDTAYLTLTKSGEVNVLVGWFTLYLTENITLTTDPRSAERSGAWLPAVFFDFIPTRYKKGETFCAQFSTFGGLLKYSPAGGKPITRVSPHVIAFVNDDRHVNEIMRSVQVAAIHLSQMAPIDKTDVADLSPFPIFGLKMLERGVRSLVCFANDYQDRCFIEEVFARHNICLSKVKILLRSSWHFDSFEGRNFHAMYCNILDLGGEFGSVLHHLARQVKQASLLKGGLFMPAKIYLVGQLISSKTLEMRNRMLEKDEAMVPLAKKVNLFAVSQATCINPTKLKFDALSSPVYLALCCQELKSSVVSVKVKNDGHCNAILCWYEIEMFENSNRISTGRNSSFVDCTAFLVKSPLDIHKGDKVTVIRCVDPDGSYKMDIDLEIE